MPFTLVSLNTRGLRQTCKRKALFLFAKQFKTDFCFFQESHSTSADTNFWKSQWDNEVWLSHGSERSAGVATLKNNFPGVVLHSDCDILGHYICSVIRHNNSTLIIVNIYGYNTKTENDKLLDSLEERIIFWLSKYPNSVLLIGGDFNIALDNTVDRWPPGQQSSHSTSLNNLMGKFNGIDIWRETFPDDRLFTRSNKVGSRHSRIDFWLVSNCVDKDNIAVNILATPLTDHRAIHINIQMLTPDNIPYKSSYWKLNNSLLKHEVVNTQINKLLTYYWNKANREKSFCTNWELFKFDACKFLRRYGSEIAKLRKTEEEEVISKIASYYQRSPEEISEDDKLILLDLQNKLDSLYRRKAEGAFVRSRKRWLEEVEQNSAYFFRLEKYRSMTNSIHQLNVNGIVSDNPRQISDFCAKFYTELYNSK